MTTERPIVQAVRPMAGVPRTYTFPSFHRDRLGNGLEVVAVHLPGRPLLSAALVILGGAGDDPDDRAGATVMMARALTEGTEVFDAVALVEATERLGASLHAQAGWDAVTVSIDVPSERFAPALDLLVDVVAHPTFPDGEVGRLRDERLNDLLQARADPSRRAEDALVGAIYASTSAYRHSAAGTRETVERLGAGDLRQALARRFDPARMTLVVGGDLAGIDVLALAQERFGTWTADPGAAATRVVDASAAALTRRVHVVHRPGSVQTEIRIGHPGLPRQTPDFHSVAVMSAILGGLFNSRLNRTLREEKGYTYGASAGFDLRRSAGPFAARAAVNTDVTVAAAESMLEELVGMRTSAPSDEELEAARNYLVGVFPLRFETPGAVVGAISGLVIQGLPDDELARYRPAIEAVEADDVLNAARAHVRPDEAVIVLVGDADAFLPGLEASGIGPVTVDRDESAEPNAPDDVDLAAASDADAD